MSEPLDPPPTAAALVIGNELLAGKVADSNVRELARTLRDLGVDLRRVVMVQDDVERIAAEVRLMATSHDWLFTSGGVGPTHDDVTVEAVAQAFGVEVVAHPELVAILRAHFLERCTPGHLLMARVPAGAELEATPNGGWPAVRVRNTWLLPGVPEAFRSKLEAVRSRIGVKTPFVTRAVYCRLDEGALKPLLDVVVHAFGDIDVGSYPQWHHPTHSTKLTFDGRDEARVCAARDAFVAILPEGEPQSLD